MNRVDEATLREAVWMAVQWPDGQQMVSKSIFVYELFAVGSCIKFSEICHISPLPHVYTERVGSSSLSAPTTATRRKLTLFKLLYN
jgi:hypothetical protein